MKKEVLIAIIVGFTLGLVITYGIYRAQSSIQTRQQEVAEQKSEGTEPTKHSLTIIQPENDGIVGEDTVEVSGVTSKNSLVTLATSESNEVVQADDLGNFTGNVELSAGINEILITSYALDGSQVSATLHVVYSTADLGDDSGNTNSGVDDQ